MFYTLIVLVLLFCIITYDVNKFSLGKDLAYFVVFILFVALCALRYRVGGDSISYEDNYLRMPRLGNLMHYIQFENIDDYQPLWLLLVACCKSVSSEFYFFQFVHAMIFNISLFWFIKRYSEYRFTVLFILAVSLLYFYFSFEILREAIAVSVFLFNIKNLEKNNWVKFYLLATVSFLFHVSAMFLFFLPLFKKIKITKKLIIMALAGSVVLYFFKSIIFDVILPFLILDSMKNKAEVYSAKNLTFIGFFAYYIVRVVIFLPLLLSYEKLNSLKYNWFYPSFFLISIISQYFLGFQRLLNYLFIIYIIIVADIMYKKVVTQKLQLRKNFVLFFTFLHVFFIFDFLLFTQNKYKEHFYSRFFPYESILSPKYNQEREAYRYNEWE